MAGRFRAELWQLLARQTALYTLGESTSIPAYDAVRLLHSACFVLGVDPNAPDVGRMRELLAEGVPQAFERGVVRLEGEARRAEGLWREVCLAAPQLKSRALRDTLESLRGFARRYDARFFAHEIPADIDYPLSLPVAEDVQGVLYVTAYLERLLAECRFLRLFDVQRCRDILRAVHPEYGELIVNLFEPVAACALGCALAGCPVRPLVADAAASELAHGVLSGAAAKICAELRIQDAETVRLLHHAAAELAPRAVMALRTGGLSGVFPGLWERG